MTRVLAIDPGVTTGWVFGWSVRELVSGQIGPRRGWRREYGAAADLVGLVREHHAEVVVLEDFILRLPAGSSGRDGLAPVRVTAMFLAMLGRDWFDDGSVVFQSASDAKGVITDARLKNEGLWIRGQEHARDAMRHWLLYQRKQSARNEQ